ncbi:hypothetical protein HZB97_01015 [Candidatus Gottesmanbacteria bacterium]|nr:hypothetical protein [Candidatus Gottesmanbacteria bacterium]
MKKYLILIVILIFGFFLFKDKVWAPEIGKFQLVKKTVSLDRKWNFVAQDKIGTPTKTKITFSLISAEKTNQIYVKNKPIRTTPDKGFLVLSLELGNTTGERVYFYSSDFVRLIGPQDKKLEADFKNPRLEISPFSTKKDKLAFLVGTQENDFQIQIGEIVGEKETVWIRF